tara:strand:- start:593 stop:919 length:327 start_codon:yes stop_codon:yes gene_type:complete
MRSNVKITKPQIKSMLDFMKKHSGKRGDNKNFNMYYHPLTPNDVYIYFISYGVENDNSISSEVVIRCIKRDGSVDNCALQFDNLKQRMQFESEFLEIDLDGNGNLIFV